MLISLLFVMPVFGREVQETLEAEEVQGSLEIEQEQEADEVQEEQEKPKEIEINKGFFPSFKYSDGETTRKLKSGELEKIILSINDEEATHHYMKSKTLYNTSFVFGVVGGALLGFHLGRVIKGEEFNTPIFATGCGITTVGLVMSIISDKERIKSAERYNQVVKEKWEINFQYVPQNSELGFKFGYSF